jgi:putative ABC transport system permease protein
MIRNYLKIAIRAAIRNSSTSLVNLLGLTIGLLSAFLIFLNVNYELRYDKFHSKSDRIYRVLSIDKALGISNNVVGITIPALAQGMKNEISQVENVVRISPTGRSLVKYKDRMVYSEDLIYTEPSFFEVFDFRLKEGDPASCLKNPSTALLTESMAKKIFGNEDPMGKIFSADGSDNLEVTGILEDEKRPGHIRFDVVVSLNPSPSDTLTAQFLSSWNSIAMVEYALLKDPAAEKEVEVAMDTILRRNKVLEAWTTTLQPLKEVHLYSSDILFDNFNQDKGNIRYVQSLNLVAIIILLIACFNYMNLATARSAKRAKEVGIRKTAGAQRRQLIYQHLAEAIVQVVISVIIALCVLELINHFYPVTKSSVIGFLFEQPIALAYLILLILILGTLSGIYPALVLSSFRPDTVLKGKFQSGKKGLWLRRFLVWAQFAASIFMIASTLIVIKQLQYTLKKDKGFNASQILTIRLDDPKIREKYESLKGEIEKVPGVKLVAASGSMPGLGYGRTVIKPEGSLSTDTWIVSIVSQNENYIPLMQMQLEEGENFRKDMSQDPAPVIVNEALVKATGWEKGLSKTLAFGNDKKALVIGVVKDFHYTSLRHKIEPLVMIYRPDVNNILSIKVEEKNMQASISAITDIWNGLYPGTPFEYKFFDDSFGELFQKEKDFSRLFFRFTLLSIFIAILGLFGLAAFSAEQRTREIGIRKTFGATIQQMVFLQAQEYIRLVMLAMLIGIPVSVYMMSRWLQSFEYRIHTGILPYLLAILLLLAVTIITVSLQSLRAARKNPAETLKYE